MSRVLSPSVVLNTSAISDTELVARAVSGSEGGFEELVRRYQRPISAYVYRMVGDYEAALDLTQEIFMKIYGSLTRYRSEFKFSTWIYKIAHNAAVDHLRRNTAREQSIFKGGEGDQYELPIESGKLSPEIESERKERRLEIETVVRALPAAYRELIILRHSQDLTYEEIVEVTGLPLGTVKNRLFRAREMMRQQFVDRGITSV
ncbi:MAG TPA: sigma-70 family RNA polymerase sigma factor [Pyrinomonadaceae bacterium]|nr:sigma-70 family RNA polymerase sigma factor [Pyrinomonadaceae bacterium]HLE63036.1 sigma-70 family RNA polymerase sigma factor [Pyrinomonadaceae bacterium]